MAETSVETENIKLNEDFVIELIKTCLISTKVLDICCAHMKYQYLSTTAQKRVFKYIIDTYNLNKKAPTVGVIGQAFDGNRDILQLLLKVKNSKVEEVRDDIVDSLESFIKESRFVIMYDKMAEMYNKDERAEAVKYSMKESHEIHSFSLKESYYPTVFKDFEERTEHRQASQFQELGTKRRDRLTWGIKLLDDLTGGFRRGTLGAFMARSGGGKSTAMRWVGLQNARLGKRVIHFSAEGSEDEVMDAYDAAWTSLKMEDVSFGDIPEDKANKIKKLRKVVLDEGGEIYVFAVSSFDSLTLLDCDRIIADIVATSGPVDLLIFDYLELFSKSPSVNVNSEGMERKRREDTANTMTNMTVKWNSAGLTATQANDIAFEKWNNPDWCMKRNEISEFKGMVKPLSYFITINGTVDGRRE